jgi:hypothetical protein
MAPRRLLLGFAILLFIVTIVILASSFGTPTSAQRMGCPSSVICPIDGLGMTYEGGCTTDPATNRVTCEFGHHVGKAHHVEHVDCGYAD